MYSHGVPDKQMMERSGPQSLGGLRSYERTTEAQKQEVSRILSDSVTISEKRQLPTKAQNVSRTFSATNSGENKQVSVLVNTAVNSGMDKVSGDGDSEAKQIVIRDASSCTFNFHFE